MKEILTLMSLDLSDDSLADTPRRIAKMYVDEIFSGLDYANFPKITVIDNKMGFDEMGGDFSQDVFRNGWAEVEFASLRWIITIKRTLIPDDSMYMFADPKFIGRMYMLEDSTMFMERRAFMIEWFCYQTMGGSIGHGGGLARADFS